MIHSFLLKACPLLYLASACGGCTESVNSDYNSKKNKAPNIIFILTDDHRWDAVGYAGNPIIQTPELDRLAKEGTFFKNAFSSTPISAASRASFLTGLFERTHGFTFGKMLDKSDVQISYPIKLKEKGYYTGYFGKLGVWPLNTESMFDESEIYDRKRVRTKESYNHKMIDGDSVHLTAYTGYKAINFIKNAPKDKPFCLSLGFSAPHAQDIAKEQYFWQDKSDERYAGITIPDPLLKEEHYFNVQPLPVQKGENRVRWHWRYDTPPKYQHCMKGYYRMIQEVDDEISSIRKVLEEKGIADNTVIIFAGDNGLFLGERQLAGKWLMYEQSIRIPLIIYDPRQKTHNDVEDMVLNVDVPKTILDYASAEIPDRYQGISLKPYVEGDKKLKARKDILIEHLWKVSYIPSSEGIRTDKWKYFRYRYIDAPEELYDLEHDPLETRNLSGYDCYQQILDSLRNLCNERIEQYIKEKSH